jgi:ABC-type branched-subunit amino acid transport system substrate-binding protein
MSAGQGITLGAAIAGLMASVAAQKTTDQSILTYVQGVPQLTADAVAKALLAAGGTPAQIQAVVDAAQSVQTDPQAILDAIKANTDAAAAAARAAPAPAAAAAAAARQGRKRDTTNESGGSAVPDGVSSPQPDWKGI